MEGLELTDSLYINFIRININNLHQIFIFTKLDCRVFILLLNNKAEIYALNS